MGKGVGRGAPAAAAGARWLGCAAGGPAGVRPPLPAAAYHLSRHLGLAHALWGQLGEVAAPLDAPLRVPRGLPMPHQDHPLRPADRRQRQRWGVHPVLQAAELILTRPQELWVLN